jgi:hypothetical protein
MRDRARIVLLAAAGSATREIGRLIGCTTGTASKWRAARRAIVFPASMRLDGAAYGMNDTAELDRRPIAGKLDHPPVMHSAWPSWLPPGAQTIISRAEGSNFRVAERLAIWAALDIAIGPIDPKLDGEA